MNPPFAFKFWRCAGSTLVIAMTILLAGSVATQARMIDQNGNGMSDVWEWLYNANGINPNQDSDGDGFSNLQEALAGTNPFDSNSFPHITFASGNSNAFTVTIPCAWGKNYQLQSAAAPVSTNWVIETNIEATAGATITLTAPVSTTMRFYRVAISDVSSDGVGLTDWEAYQLGLNPANGFSNGQEDSNGNAMNDYNYAVAKLAQQNVITISATGPTATQPDPGQGVTAPGQFTITRGGFPLTSLTINLATNGPGPGFGTPGVDFVSLPTAIIFPAGTSSMTFPLTPMPNTNLQAPVLAQWKLMPGSHYTLGTASNASVVVYPSPTSKGAGLTGQYYTNSSTTYTNAANFNPTNLFLTRIDPTIDFNWTNGTSPDLSNGLYTVRWTGQVQPQFSETYIFDVKSDDGCRLWVNDQLLIDKWQSQGVTDWTNSITLVAGARYDIKLDYLQTGGAAQAHLYWYSPSQPEVIIPNNCLYPSNSFVTNATNAASVVTSALTAVAFLGQPFTFTVTAANVPLGFTASGLPPGLSFNTNNGLISGVPTLAGNFLVSLTSSNHAGIGASTLAITVFNTGSSVVQEIWTNVPGMSIASIPTGTPANMTNVLGTLEGSTDYGNNYGERIRGFFTAPVTGNYYFWIAGSDSAQLWISDDGDPVDKVLRASVAPTNNPSSPPQYGTSSHQWTVQSGQQSAWLTLAAGQQYYVEILHKVGVDSSNNWSVAWLQDPTGTNNTPGGGVVPGYLLSRYYPPLPVNVAGTLYSANMLALTGVNSQGVGSATLRVSADGSTATLNFQIANMVGMPTGESINSDPYLSDPGELVYDISASKPQPDGSYLWKLEATGPLAVSDIQEIIREGKASIVIESSAFPNGEITGHFTPANGAGSFAPPPAPPAWTDDSANTNAAVRFLTQATFGASPSDITNVQALGYAGWISNQFSLPATHHLPYVQGNPYSDPTDLYQSPLTFASWWQKSVTAPDQLRQRVAFALSEIVVVSENGVLQNHADGLSSYYDMLLDNAFGNFRNLLERVTLHPAMGLYLNMQGNSAGSIITGVHADENYAREIQQLFSIGLNRMWPDGTLILNAQGNLVPTYNQNVIMGFASVFTGWTYYQTNQANGRLPSNFFPPANYTNYMVLVPTHHELGAKLLLDNVMLPAAQGASANSSLTNYDYYCSQDLEQALNTIFNNQNVAPFICRELIQRLVTSNPSRDYVYRVASVFNDDGTGVRGNMQAVVQAILLDYEARSPAMIPQPDYGKQREPLVRVTSLARAFPAPAIINGTYTQTTNQVISITNSSPHRMGSGDVAFLTFTDTSGYSAPTSQGYTVTVVNPTNFTVNAPQLLSGSYGQTNGVITLNLSGNGLASNNPVYLVFTTGGASNGLYSVSNVIDSAHFTVAAIETNTRSGNCLLPKISAGGYTQTGTTILISTSGNHGLVAGNNVYINFSSGTAVDGTYTIATVPNPTHFTITAGTSANQNQNILTVYSLTAPQLARSGTVTIRYDTWNMGYTDSGSSSSLMETPLRSPTVFNFYHPEYEFPGALASAGMTTPEFELTTDSGVSSQMNFLESGILNNTGNTNGLSSFNSGSIVLDIGPWMTPAYTSNAGIPALVSNLNTLLAAGQLSASAQSSIVSYVASTNFSYTTPTYTQMRDRVRAVVHQIVNSPDYMIQK
ncbi:MAG TPA: DUF1800 family protein [Verrucomicrobiae bacterium]|nr:DUF1800 family protein [Verrucomicrobiae bacterium]